MNIKSLFAVVVIGFSVGSSRAASDIEATPVGYRKIYPNGYFELICKDKDASLCSITIKLGKSQRTYILDMGAYGYKRAWDPIGAFIIQKRVEDPVSFYLTVDCSGEDYRFSNHSEGEVKCSALGRISKGQAHLEQIKIDSLINQEEDPVYRQLERR